MKTNYILAILAVVAGLSAAFTRYGEHNKVYPDWKYASERIDGKMYRFISASQLADLLYSKDQELMIYDTRPWEAYDSYHIPQALQCDEGTVALASAGSATTVLYGNPEDPELYTLARDLPGRVYLLEGGLESWYSQVLFPDFLSFSIRNPDQLDHILRRSAFFGGKPLNTQVLNIDVRESRYREGC